MYTVLCLVLTAAVITSNADVIRTVYCQNKCSDYLDIPENSMPLCAAEHLKFNECGTVVICDWAEADRDKIRPVANSSSILCCYQSLIKEKGDCVEDPAPQADVVQVAKPVHNRCEFHHLPWLLCLVLLAIIILQTGYIAKLRISGPKHQKVTQSDETNLPQAVVSQPLINT